MLQRYKVIYLYKIKKFSKAFVAFLVQRLSTFEDLSDQLFLIGFPESMNYKKPLLLRHLVRAHPKGCARARVWARQRVCRATCREDTRVACYWSWQRGDARKPPHIRVVFRSIYRVYTSWLFRAYL